MNNKWKILLGVLIVSGIVFAAVETKFYGNINLQNNKVVNMGTPTSTKDGANKTYVDTQITTAVASKLDKSGGTMSGALSMGSQKITDLGTPTASTDGANKSYVDLADSAKLSLSGGTMMGQISMGGYRIFNLANPTANKDATTKEYVDSAINNANSYQYFALKKGSGYTPIYHLSSNTNRQFSVVVLRQFTGSLTSYVENIHGVASKHFASKTWKVGETIKVPFGLAPETFSETNGTLIVKGGDGVLGNFGITAPPNGITPFTCSVSFNGNTYAPNTAVSIYNNGWDSNNKCFTFKIKNTSGRTISSPSFQFPKVPQYASPTEYSTYTLEFNGSIYSAMPQNITLGGSWANNAELNGKLYILDLDVNTNGLRWQFKVSADGSEYTFGQFFLPNVE